MNKNKSKTLSILGSGWLGLALTKELSQTYDVNLSTTTKEKKDTLEDSHINSFLVDIGSLSEEVHQFLQHDILIINIPSKNIDGFKNLIQYILKSNIKKIIFISSTSVCNNDKSPLKTIEMLFQDTDIETTILRFGGLFGYERNPANFFKNGNIVKNPQAPVNMIHRDDCIGIIKEILYKDIFGEVFNCVSPSHPTKEEFYTHCALSSDLVIPKFDSIDDVTTHKIIHADKLIAKLDYKFIHEDLLK
ncbi:MAG: nucleoside-diphosphate-sugar epimerase [Sulfurimonas sp.]|jgi:nucleoside-diphosphate-sugar epimerase